MLDTSLTVRIGAKDPEMEHLAAAYFAKSLRLCFPKRVCESLHPLKVRISVSKFCEAKDFELRTHSEHISGLLLRKSQARQSNSSLNRHPILF